MRLIKLFTRRLTVFAKNSSMRDISEINGKLVVCPHCRTPHNPSPPMKHFKYLKQLTGQEDHVILNFLNQYRSITKLSEENLKAGIEAIKDYGLSNSPPLDLLPLLKNHLVTIRNRIMVLLEVGILHSRLTPKMVSSYLSVCKMSVELLKSKGLISPETDVLEKLLSHTDYPKELLEKLDRPQILDKLSIFNFKKEAVRIYFKWKLDMNDEEFDDDGELMYRLKNKSFRDIMKNIRISENMLDIKGERLRKNKFLLSMDPENAEEIFKKVPEVSDVPINELVNCRAKIITCSVDNLLKTKQYLKEFNIKKEALLKRPEILTLSSNTILKRLKQLHKVEFFRLYVKNPRFLDLLYYEKKASKRLELIQDLKLMKVNMNVLSAPNERFEKFYDIGLARITGVDVKQFLSSELELPKNVLKKVLDLHPLWFHVSLIDVSNCLTALLSRGFTKEEIIRDPYILLYPREKVIQALDKIEEKGDELDCCREGGSNKVKREFILRLVVYYLEREVGFTGEAVWDTPPLPGYNESSNSKDIHNLTLSF